jgi:GTP-binding protein Era
MAPEAAHHRCGHVAIVGRPNVGKSTLLNRLVEQKLSITSRKPQTTRHPIRGIVTRAQSQLVFVDTPGFQTHVTGTLRLTMNRTVMHTLADIDCVVLVMVAGRITTEDEAVMRLLPRGKARVIALNKVDRVSEPVALLTQLEKLSALVNASAIVPLSAQTGYQVDVLLQALERLLPEQDALYPAEQLTDRDERFFAAEFVREKVFRSLGDELPYASTVIIERFEQRNALRRIHATILVEKQSHKAIVIGAGGERLKTIGTAARKDLERMFGGMVYLRLWVKVRRAWSEDAHEIKRLGLA